MFNNLATSVTIDDSASEAFCSFSNATVLHLGSSNVARPNKNSTIVFQFLQNVL